MKGIPFYGLLVKVAQGVFQRFRVHPWKLTWHWNITMFSRKCIFKWWMFYCHAYMLVCHSPGSPNTISKRLVSEFHHYFTRGLFIIIQKEPSPFLSNGGWPTTSRENWSSSGWYPTVPGAPALWCGPIGSGRLGCVQTGDPVPTSGRRWDVGTPFEIPSKRLTP